MNSSRINNDIVVLGEEEAGYDCGEDGDDGGDGGAYPCFQSIAGKPVGRYHYQCREDAYERMAPCREYFGVCHVYQGSQQAAYNSIPIIHGFCFLVVDFTVLASEGRAAAFVSARTKRGGRLLFFEEGAGGFYDVVFAEDDAFGLFYNDVGPDADTYKFRAVSEFLMAGAYSAEIAPAEVDVYRIAGATAGRRTYDFAAAGVSEEYGEVFCG